MELKKEPFTIAVVGHPGAGKTTLAQALSLQPETAVVDLPGVHLLSPSTDAGKEVYHFLLGLGGNILPRVILVLLDARKVLDQLYFVGQVIDLRLPVVVGLTHVEAARRGGAAVRHEWLANQLFAPVVPIEHPEADIAALHETLMETAEKTVPSRLNHWRPSMGLGEAYNHLDSEWSHRHLRMLHSGARLIEGLRLIGTPKATEDYEGHPAHKSLKRVLDEARQKMTDRKENWTMAELGQRHQWAQQLAGYAVQEVTPDARTRFYRWLATVPKAWGWGLILLALATLAGIWLAG